MEQNNDIMTSLIDQSNTVDVADVPIRIPEVGMSFSSESALREYYSSYSQTLGFGICKLGARNGVDGKQKYFTIACAKSGFKASRSKNVLKSRPSTKTKCNAKINVVVRKEDEFVISSVFLEHNHMFSPTKSRYHKSHIVLDSMSKRRLKLNDEAEITLTKSLQSFVVEAGGYDKLSFGERSCRNYIEDARRLRLGNGDAQVLSNYFLQMQNRCCNFFHQLDLDEESRIKNVFWADGRCRAAYKYFSDVITFDTTYLTNRYDMPFAPFVGVNHHGQSILLGCGLLLSEDSESFIWLFETWLACMHGRAPKTIITDQCRSMTIAIEKVFPTTQHRYCLWHIMKKIPAKIGAHAEYEMIKKILKNIVYNSITIEQCDHDWLKMIEEFGLEQNDWLNSLYLERGKWIPVYVKNHFWAEMSTSQRSESMNAFFDDFVHSKTSLKQFVEQYDKSLKKKIEKETKLDFQSFNSSIPIVSGYALEMQIRSFYTNDIFKLFQNELIGLMYCDISTFEEGTTSIFQVIENILGINGEHLRDVTYKVFYIKNNCCVSCQCQMFEFRGILCRHIITVFRKMKVNEVPMYYIIDRWRKDIKRDYQSITNIYEMCDSEKNRYNILTPLVQEVQHLASKSEANSSLLIEVLKDVKEKLLSSTSTDKSKETSTSTEKVIHSPKKVRARGRPPTKRKQSTLEIIAEKNLQKLSKQSRKKSVVESSPIFSNNIDVLPPITHNWNESSSNADSFVPLLSSQLSTT